MTDKDAPVTTRFRLQTLDRFALLRWDPVSESWVSTGLAEKPSALIAHLIWAGAPVQRSVLARLLWEEFDEPLARNSLRQALFKVRSVLGDGCMKQTSDGVMFTQSIEADLACFSRLPGTLGARSADSTQALLRFARRSGIRSVAFDQWVGRVRASGSLLASDITPINAAFVGRESTPPALEVDTALGLLELWQRSAPGTPVSVWIPDATSREVRQGVEFVIGHCRAHGGSVAEVRVESERYRPYVLEHTLAKVLWDMPGAAGVRPEHRELLRSIHGASEVSASALTAALLDLISAVAEDAPLLIVLEEPEVYSRGALRALVHGIPALKGCSVLFLVLARAGAAPVAPLYFWRPTGIQATA